MTPTTTRASFVFRWQLMVREEFDCEGTHTPEIHGRDPRTLGYRVKQVRRLFGVRGCQPTHRRDRDI